MAFSLTCEERERTNPFLTHFLPISFWAFTHFTLFSIINPKPFPGLFSVGDYRILVLCSSFAPFIFLFSVLYYFWVAMSLFFIDFCIYFFSKQNKRQFRSIIFNQLLCSLSGFSVWVSFIYFIFLQFVVYTLLGCIFAVNISGIVRIRIRFLSNLV